MTIEQRTRILIIDNAAHLLCLECGRNEAVPVDWQSLAELADAARHGPCDQLGQPGVSPAPERFRRFVDECMVLDAGRQVSMEAARDAYDEWPGNEGHLAEYSTFGRWFRQVMPAGVRVHRRLIDGERHNWIIGMRLR